MFSMKRAWDRDGVLVTHRFAASGRKARRVIALILLGAVAVYAIDRFARKEEGRERVGAASGRLSDLRELAAWNNEMIRAHGRGDISNAARIARRILSRPEWRSFIPANAVLGSALAHERDFAAAEVFFRAALVGKGAAAPQPVVMNDYADTLCNMGRYAEAEAFARRAIAASGGKMPLFRLTLDEILRAAGKNRDEVNSKENET